jgi:class 3 adenylate cyclase
MRLRKGETNIADHFEDATIIFTDVVGFFKITARMSAFEIVSCLNRHARLRNFRIIAERGVAFNTNSGVQAGKSFPSARAAQPNRSQDSGGPPTS